MDAKNINQHKHNLYNLYCDGKYVVTMYLPNQYVAESVARGIAYIRYNFHPVLTEEEDEDFERTRDDYADYESILMLEDDIEADDLKVIM